jgi:ATP-dependent Zn protease
MGGRVAEQLSKQHNLLRNKMADGLLVYGEENVSSGASSDIQRATQVARNMVKVR